MAVIEYSFEKNDFNSNTKYDKYVSVIIRLQRLITMKKGSDINDPNKGIDIKSYMYEDLNNGTISNIKSEITSQAIKYLPEINLSDVEIEIIDSSTLDVTKTKGIDINIKYTIQNEDKEKTAKLKFIKQKNSTTLISNVVL